MAAPRITPEQFERLTGTKAPANVRKTRPRKSKPPATREPIPAAEAFMALDVSSSAAGLAIVTGGGGIMHLQRIAPSNDSSVDRIDRIVLAIGEVLGGNFHFVRRVVMEWQSHKFAARQTNAQGLAVLGQAQGHVRQALLSLGATVETVSEREWTRSKSKQNRARTVHTFFPAYAEFAGNWNDGKPKGDPGLDVADAVGLAMWRIGR